MRFILRLKKTFPICTLKSLSLRQKIRIIVFAEEFVMAERKIRKFRKYTIGYLHIDTLFSPKIAKKRYYIFTAIDRVSKVGFLRVSTKKTKEMGAGFLRKVLRFYPYAIHYILTDNGFEFSYKALPKGKKRRNLIHLISSVKRMALNTEPLNLNTPGPMEWLKDSTVKSKAKFLKDLYWRTDEIWKPN